MRVGTLKQISDHKSRVSITPSGARGFEAHGYDVPVDKAAGPRRAGRGPGLPAGR